MLNYTIILMNDYLKTIHLNKINYFYEKDFETITMMPRYFHGTLTACTKRQSIIYNNHLFHISVKCIADERIDEISYLSVYSEEGNHENHEVMAQCLYQLIINFSSFISNDLYQALLTSPTIKSLYNSILQKLQRKHQRLCTNKPLDIYDIKKIDSSKIKDIPYNVYLIIYIYEDNIINISLMFDLYHQL
ncbi:MAG: hypothetical protein LUG12_06060 [Erysipelotrichaceae bacterium]|nr:hypothetical protein [Erysipelotrichaceae bacterium]